MRKTVTENSARVIAKAGVALFFWAVFSAHAMSLGELQGNALIGQPLDLTIPIQVSQGDKLSEGCVRADIYYGDARQKAPRITTQATQLRLQTSTPVNEPVVTLQIHNFCGVSQIRNYVLLADLPPDFSASVATSTLTPAAQPTPPNAELAPTVVVLPQVSVASTPKASSATPRKPVSSAVKNIKSVKKQKTKAAPPKRTPEGKTASAQPVRSVLKLDPMEILSDRMDTLELNMPFVPAEDALLQSRQLAALQAEVKSMRELAVKNDSALLELQGQLQLAQSQQQLTTLFYVLIPVLLLGLASLLWLWQRQKKLTLAAQSWWQRPTSDDLSSLMDANAASLAASPGMTATLTDGTLTDMPTGKRPVQAVPVAAQTAEADPVVALAPLKINPESVQDIRQQAEFFVSLGQAHRAIEILNQHMAGAGVPNPLICMDLLELYQHANKTAEFDQLRDVCRQHFNVKLPDMAISQNEGLDLTHYPAVVTTLTRLWPGEQAQAYMDTCIFLNTGSKAKTAFDLAAFRDLLTLHAAAEELAASVTQRPNPQARQAGEAPDPLHALDVFLQRRLPGQKSETHRTESPEGNLPGLDLVLPHDTPPGKP